MYLKLQFIFYPYWFHLILKIVIPNIFMRKEKNKFIFLRQFNKYFKFFIIS